MEEAPENGKELLHSPHVNGMNEQVPLDHYILLVIVVIINLFYYEHSSHPPPHAVSW